MIFRRYRKSLKKIWRRVENRFFGGKRILVLGDSHCGVFEYSFDHGFLAPHLLNCEIVAGATAYGLNGEHSVTQAWQKFDGALLRFNNADTIVIVLGECDCSFALWARGLRLEVAPATLIGDSLAGLRRLLGRIKDDPRLVGKQVILIGAILPTVADDSLAIQENILRRSIGASQLERTRLVLEYNDRLSQMATELGLTYFDLTEQTRNSETGMVDARFVARPDDHHLSHSASGPLWSKRLLELL
jgi:hypothetical protein